MLGFAKVQVCGSTSFAFPVPTSVLRAELVVAVVGFAAFHRQENRPVKPPRVDPAQ